MMSVVLVEPEIPQNTGNVARTCVLTNSRLHLIKPMGFSLDDKYLRRAGLDYWNLLEYYLHESWDDFINKYDESRFIYFSTKGDRLYTELEFNSDDFLVFGSETSGLPDNILSNSNDVFRLPMSASIERSLNLSNTVAVVLFEALRQHNFPGMI